MMQFEIRHVLKENAMNIDTPLFEGKLICLAPIDHERDPEIVSGWSHNAAYLRMLDPKPARPLSQVQVKKQYEAVEKEIEESKNLFYFAIHSLPTEGQPERLLGFVKLGWIDWAHGNGVIQIGIGDPSDWGKGYGSDTLRLIMRFAFSELNLHRLTARVPEYNLAALALFRKTGFVEEVRRREAFQRDARRWDDIHLGLLAADWQTDPSTFEV
jgi:RimJ/RimL family protein N-acetyltransferase